MKQRVLLIFGGGVLLVPLIVAWLLTPSPIGMGTHQQLGLPACSMVQWFRIRCPACGMTTSWSYMVRGQFGSSFGVNSGGALLAIAAIVTSPWLLVSGLWGKYISAPPPLEWIAYGSIAVGLVTLADWGFRIFSSLG